MDGYEVYKIYLSLKLHFSKDNYNFFTFNGKSRASLKSFENRKDKYFFKKLGLKFQRQELIEFFVSHFIVDGNLWIGNISIHKSKTYSTWKSKMQSMSFIFENEMQSLFYDRDFDSVFKIDNGKHPDLLKEHLSGRVSLESMVILNQLVNYIPHFSNKISDPIVWPETKKKVVKYEPFLSINKSKYKSILLNLCNSSTTT
mgnify:CR=1 FL=1|tara:strand:+ start:3447 stop:4046 length:600 start_codon:yes stop_codon:yes gene_type:complete